MTCRQKKLAFERAHGIIKGDKNVDSVLAGLKKPVAPTLRILLSEAEMNALIDEAWRKTKSMMKERIGKQIQEQERREKEKMLLQSQN